MRVGFKTSFARDVKRLRDKAILVRVSQVIEEVEVAGSLVDIKNLRKLRAEGRYYRIRLGDYIVIHDPYPVSALFIRTLYTIVKSSSTSRVMIEMEMA